MSELSYEQVKQAVEEGGSQRAAARLLKKSHTSIRYWLAVNGYRIERKSVLVKIQKKAK